MAAGDVIIFDQFGVDLGNKIHDLDGDTWKVGFITSSTTPADSDAAPHFGGTGTTNMATNECSAGGNYSAGGVTLTSVAYSNSAGVVSWVAAKISVAQHASNPTNARWGILYNSTDANKRCAAYLDFGSVIDLTQGPFEFRFNSVDGTGAIATNTIN
jgi:hypothetical protein